jgi:hypothetical protein
MPSTKVSRADKSIKQILAATYPEYKGRKISVSPATRYQLSDYWSEGSRNYAKAYNLATGTAASPEGAVHTPFNSAAHAEIRIPVGVLIVEHTIFCGHDCGITIYANPENLTKFLPAEATT